MGKSSKNLCVVSVTERHVIIRRGDDVVATRWEDLRAAAHQDDPTLRAIYESLLEQADEMAKDTLPLTATAELDPENRVWWLARLLTAQGHDLRSRFRRADEGGSCVNAEIAMAEAKSWAERARAQGRSVHVVYP